MRRDHNPSGFTIWLAGAGVKPGASYGATDELGYRVVVDVTSICDLHATILHLVGLDHERLNFYHNAVLSAGGPTCMAMWCQASSPETGG